MLLVHHHQGQPPEGQEEGRAGSHHDPAPAFRHSVPDLSPLGRGDAGVPLTRGAAEAFRNPCDQGLGQGDLRQQDQDLGRRIRVQGGADRFQVNLGLSRSRHAVQEGGLETALGDHRLEGRGGGGLAGVEGRRGQVQVGRPKRFRRRREAKLEGTVVDQAPDHGGGDPRPAGEVRGHGGTCGGGLKDPGAGRGGAGGRAAGGRCHPVGTRRRGSRTAQGDGQGQAGDVSGIAGGPLHELQGGGAEWRRINSPGQGLQRPVPAGALAQPGHHPGHKAAPEGRGDLVAHSQLQALGRLVVEGLGEGQGQEDGGDAAHLVVFIPRVCPRRLRFLDRIRSGLPGGGHEPYKTPTTEADAAACNSSSIPRTWRSSGTWPPQASSTG